MIKSCRKLGLVTILFAASSAISAKDFSGVLTVESSLALDGTLRRTKILTPGSYHVDIDLHPVLNRITVELDRKSYRFKYPASLNIPRQEGRVSILATHSKQPVDMHLQVKTDTMVGAPYTTTESCVYEQVPYTTCDNGVCHTSYHTIYGIQHVTRHQETATHHYMIDFSQPQTSTRLARFKGDDVETQTFVDHTTPCRRT